MATPMRKVPVSRKSTEPRERKRIPAVTRISEPNNVISKPNRRASLGANGEITAKASKGIVVRKPANRFEIPKSSRIGPIIGPTDVKGERSVKPMKSIPMTKSQLLLEKFSFLVVCTSSFFKKMPPIVLSGYISKL